MANWLILTATLPTRPSGLRVRVWRALKATAAGTLREGVYVLPEHAPTAQALWDLESSISEAGADAHLLIVASRDETQEKAFRALFDRSELYAEFVQTIKQARAGIRKSTGEQLHKSLRALEQRLRSIQSSDFFAGKASHKAGEALAALRREVALQLSPDEPAATDAAIASLSVANYQGRTWVTRKRPWVDRLGTAWLVQRFVDKKPTFTWHADPKKCPKSALGYDFDGARFSHVGHKVTFEVVAESFGLLEDPALRRLAALVRYLDTGGIPPDEAAGLEMVVRGLHTQHADNDNALLGAAIAVFDAVYAAMQEPDAR